MVSVAAALAGVVMSGQYDDGLATFYDVDLGTFSIAELYALEYDLMREPQD